MRYLILMGSPRKNGNTVQTTLPIVRYLEGQGHETDLVWLYDLDIKGCIACRACQKNPSGYSCRWKDDMQLLFDKTLACDCIIAATPIYGWFCTAPLKAALDRFIYIMCKFYGETRGPALWEGKKLALISTCGYPPEKGSDLFEEGMRRYAKHCRLKYIGAFALNDPGYQSTFMTEDKMRLIEDFAVRLEQAAKA